MNRARRGRVALRSVWQAGNASPLRGVTSWGVASLPQRHGGGVRVLGEVSNRVHDARLRGVIWGKGMYS